MLKSLVFVKNVRFLGFTLLGRVGPCMLSLIHAPDPCIYTNPTQLYTTTDIQIQCSINQFGVILSVQKKQRRRFRQIEIENTQYCCFLRAPQPRRRAQTHSLTHTARRPRCQLRSGTPALQLLVVPVFQLLTSWAVHFRSSCCRRCLLLRSPSSAAQGKELRLYICLRFQMVMIGTAVFL